MDQFRDCIESEELREAIGTFQDALKKHAPQRKPRGQPSFSSIALQKRFQADKAASLISAIDPQYPGISHVLFLGFCGWVLSPSDETLRNALMIHGVLDYFAESEARLGLVDQFDLQADMVARYILIGPDFLDDVYHALGGHIGFDHGVLRPVLGDWLSGDQRSIFTFVKACKIFHFAVDHLNDFDLYRKISVTSVIDILSGYRDDKLIERSVFYEKWSEKKSTVGLLYAASTIEIGHSTLLDNMLSGEVTAQTFIASFDIWRARARYFCDHVLSQLGVEGLMKENLKPLKSVKAEPFESNINDQQEIRFLTRKFARKQ